MSSETIQQTAGELEPLVRSFKFDKITSFIHVLPGMFITGFILSALLMLVEALSLNLTLFTSSIVSSFLIASLLSSSVSTYILLDKVINHLYTSGVTTYYFLGGGSFNASLYYLKNRLSKAKIPSPATGLVLSLVTGGFSYPIIISLVEKTLRDHMIDEEEALLGKKLTPYFFTERIIVEIALVFLTLGTYLIYQSFRVVKTYNSHIERVHATHPNPPPRIEYETTVYEPAKPLAFFIGLLLTFSSLHAVLGYLGLPSIFLMNFGIGLAWSFVNLKLRNNSVSRILLVNAGLIYLMIMLSIMIGVAGYRTYSLIFRESLQGISSLQDLPVLSLSGAIFLNNMGIALASITPCLGTIPMSVGVNNAGLVIGTLTPEKLAMGDYSPILLLIMPHAILELISYSFFITFAFTWRRPNSWRLLIVGLLILALAALVEAFTVKIK
ncbi:hypothetical protein IMZ38_05140 [Thermosphaera chiliense]|uniref:Stage II sporulation protein M n=1 Tax=Thermosphaera chiliense TaxID=3402707 RepID=A0A7M1UP32_9CREN|nr:hypothetical protein [Thermosphaera aggregans]QOR94028.1 hypothetical protein IMZ38_05140 [Thermosphaera aggregans]